VGKQGLGNRPTLTKVWRATHNLSNTL